MYKIVKEEGKIENVFLQNTDTMAEVNLGRISPAVIRILTEDGYKFEDITGKEDDSITFKEKWNLKVNNEDTKDKLRKLAMPMKKPIRDQRKIKTEQKKEEKKIVDVLDIIYGLA